MSGVFYTDGKIEIPNSPAKIVSACYFTYSIASAFFEMGVLASAAVSVEFDPCFTKGTVAPTVMRTVLRTVTPTPTPGVAPTAWDRYELIIFLWAQSSVSNTVGSILTIIISSLSFRDMASSLAKGEAGRESTQDAGREDQSEADTEVTAVEERLTLSEDGFFSTSGVRLTICTVLGCSVLPAFITHTVVMTSAYIYVFCAIALFGAVGICVLGYPCLIAALYPCYNWFIRCMRQRQANTLARRRQAGGGGAASSASSAGTGCGSARCSKHHDQPSPTDTMAPPGSVSVTIGSSASHFGKGAGQTGKLGQTGVSAVAIQLNVPPPPPPQLPPPPAEETQRQRDADGDDLGERGDRGRVACGCIQNCQKIQPPECNQELAKCIYWGCCDDCSDDVDGCCCCCSQCLRPCIMTGLETCCASTHTEITRTLHLSDGQTPLPILAPLFFYVIFILVTQTMVSYGILLYGRGGFGGGVL